MLPIYNSLDKRSPSRATLIWVKHWLCECRASTSSATENETAAKAEGKQVFACLILYAHLLNLLYGVIRRKLITLVGKKSEQNRKTNREKERERKKTNHPMYTRALCCFNALWSFFGWIFLFCCSSTYSAFTMDLKRTFTGFSYRFQCMCCVRFIELVCVCIPIAPDHFHSFNVYFNFIWYPLICICLLLLWREAFA